MPEGVCQRWLQAVTCRRDMVSELPRTPNLRGNDIELSWKPVYPCAAVAHGVDDRPGDLLLLLLLPPDRRGHRLRLKSFRDALVRRRRRSRFQSPSASR